jgi:hypothetical protein
MVVHTLCVSYLRANQCCRLLRKDDCEIGGKTDDFVTVAHYANAIGN